MSYRREGCQSTLCVSHPARRNSSRTNPDVVRRLQVVVQLLQGFSSLPVVANLTKEDAELGKRPVTSVQSAGGGDDDRLGVVRRCAGWQERVVLRAMTSQLDEVPEWRKGRPISPLFGLRGGRQADGRAHPSVKTIRFNGLTLSTSSKLSSAASTSLSWSSLPR